MKEVLDELLAAFESGKPSALATVVRTWRSAPRPAGASMLVTESGEAVGSISGGCVEGAVYELSGDVIKDGEVRYETYGISNDDAFAVGLIFLAVSGLFMVKGKKGIKWRGTFFTIAGILIPILFLLFYYY